MRTFHLNDLPKEKRIQMIAEFYDVIDFLKDRKEIRLFFKDLLTGDEIATLMRRIEVAILIEAGFTYDEISKTLGVGRGKINNVQKVLAKDGDGYRAIIRKLLQDRKERLKNKKEIKERGSSNFQKMKKIYPGHFLLNNLIDKIPEGLNEDLSKEKEALFFTPSLTNYKKTKKTKKNNHSTVY